MGKGEIISGGTDGQYQVKVIFDKTNYDTLLATLNAKIPELETQISTLQSQISQLDSDISTLNQRIDDVRAERDSYNPGSKEYQAKDRELNNLISQKNSKVSEKRRKEIDKKIKELEKKSLEKRLEYIENNFPDDETLSAWCADLTEDLSGNVGTLEVPGERGTLLIQPGYEDNAVYNLSRDGQLQPLIAANPYQTYYNLAMFPGWQKWKPTFRFGTITSIDSENDMANVMLDSTSSSQQALDINQTNTLADVPVEYMQCNSAAFEEGDEVVVKFEYDWTTPIIIGFKDNPKSCYTDAIMFKLGDSYLAWDIISEDILFGPATDIEMSAVGYDIGIGFSDVNGINRGTNNLLTISLRDETIAAYVPNYQGVTPVNRAACGYECEAAESTTDESDSFPSDLNLPNGDLNPANSSYYLHTTSTNGVESGECSNTAEFIKEIQNVNLRFDTPGDTTPLPSKYLKCKYGGFESSVVTNQFTYQYETNGVGDTLCYASGRNYSVDFESGRTYDVYTPVGDYLIELNYQNCEYTWTNYTLNIPIAHTINSSILTDGSSLLSGQYSNDGKMFYQLYISIVVKKTNDQINNDYTYYFDERMINIKGNVFNTLGTQSYIYSTNPFTQTNNSIFTDAIEDLIEHYIDDKSIPDDEAPPIVLESIYF